VETKVLITGGAGFIGSNLSAALIENGYSVVIYDNLFSGKKENLPKKENKLSVEFLEGDIRYESQLRQAFEGVDAVVHLAALVDIASSVADPALTNEVNVTGTLNVLKEASRCKVKRLVFASSTAVYGDTKELPINENTPVNSISPYAASKLAGEAYCKAFQASYDLSTVVLRFFNVYGPRNQNSLYSGVITKFLQQATRGEALNIFGDGEQTRDFIHVNDIVEALMLALQKEEAVGETFNVCTGIPISINMLAQAVQMATKQNLTITHSPARAGEIKYSYGDPSKAAKKLKFKAKTRLAEGINTLIETQKRA
jgi:UDP-glucose 4-epimerase